MMIKIKIFKRMSKTSTVPDPEYFRFLIHHSLRSRFKILEHLDFEHNTISSKLYLLARLFKYIVREAAKKIIIIH